MNLRAVCFTHLQVGDWVHLEHKYLSDIIMSFSAASNLPSGGPHSGSSSDALYRELWHACAGPLVTLPRQDERVYYFPQGHMEQLEASMNQGLEQQMPSFNLASKILCKVVNVVLRAEPDTDEVYAQITLLPESNQSEVTTPDPALPEPTRSNSRFLNILPYDRTSRSTFLVSLNKYLEAQNHKLSVGMRFKMRFEGEEVPERSFSGTIVGLGDNASPGWANSDWRSLKVQWDEPSSILRPDRVSAWELEPLVASNPLSSQPTQRNKRPRPTVLPSPTADAAVLGGWKPTVESSAFSFTEPPQRGRDVYSSPKFSTAASNSLGFNGNSSLGAVSSNNYWSNTNRVENIIDTSSHGANREPIEKKQNTRNGCRLFGIQLLGNSDVGEASPDTTPKMVSEDRSVPPVDTEFDQNSERSNVHRLDIPSVSCDADKSCLISPLESQSRQIRSCTKVHMQGIAVGRAVDLTRFNQYDDLLRKLEEMFDIEGELCGSVKKWQVVYTDDEDDMMMVGDDPWNEFVSMVRKIFIYTTEEVKRLSPKIKLPLGGETKLSKPDSDTTANHTEDQSSIVGGRSNGICNKAFVYFHLETPKIPTTTKLAAGAATYMKGVGESVFVWAVDDNGGRKKLKTSSMLPM
ncbi:Auxin response factor 1, partial [Cucurbita argyrosperma subsp. sororia]